MSKNNIVFNMSLEQYNKKYRNRRHRLVKFTKKEVEEFDRVNKTSNKFLLGVNNRKWAYIDGTYYEIPKAPRYTWFRNLNAACQVGTCVLAAGVVAAAITVPVVLLNQNKGTEPTVTVQGADYDIEASHIELNKNSYIVLKQKGEKEIVDVEEIKVGGNKITKETDWNFKADEKKVNIFAHAMTSLNIEIKVQTGEPAHEITKEEWVAAADALYLKFKNTTKVYNKTQLSNVEYGVEGHTISGTVDKVDYSTWEYEGIVYKDFYVYAGGDLNGQTYAGYAMTDGQTIKDGLAEVEDGGHFVINSDGSLYYYNDNDIAGYLVHLSINKFGYATSSKYHQNDDTYFIAKATYTGEPKEPETTLITLGSEYDATYGYNVKNVTIKPNTSYKIEGTATSSNKIRYCVIFDSNDNVVGASDLSDSYVVKVNNITSQTSYISAVGTVMFGFDSVLEEPIEYEGTITVNFTTKNIPYDLTNLTVCYKNSI